MHTDVIVVGSGYGGSVVAARTAQAGLRVLLLERGDPLDNVRWQSINEGRTALHRGMYQNGPLDIHALRGLGALTGNALGGGSRINTAVTIRPRPEIFRDSWPRGIDQAALSPCYERVETAIRPSTCSDNLPRIQWMRRLGQFLQIAVTPLPLAMDWSQIPESHHQRGSPSSIKSELGGWFRGPLAMKRGLNQTYLRLATENGACVQTGSFVRVIEPIPGGFRIWFDRLADGESRPDSVTARRVVVAAGTLSSVRLLFANRDEHRTLPRISTQLGERFFTNGDRGALLIGDTYDWAADLAPPAIAWFDHWEPNRFFMMDLGRMPILRDPLLASIARLAHQPHYLARPLHDMKGKVPLSAWIVGIMGANEKPRRLMNAGNGHLRCKTEHTSEACETVNQSSIDMLANAAGASWLMVPAWLERRMPLTVHPLGGAVMADSPELGVTDSHGEVFGHPGLFIADGSLVPTPTGVPPSMTIAALAERVATRVAESVR